MSGGEPSSIKRRRPGAAASLHPYAEQHNRGAHPRGPVLFATLQTEQKGGCFPLYRALYRKWRPRRFADVVGQQPIVTALQNQIAAGRIGHAYLFTGTRGTGKTSCAKIFAKAVNCLDTTSPDPCGECAVCKGIDEGTVLDVSEIDAASNNSVDDIRDLRDETAYLPAMCRYKVYIIDEVHMLSTSAFNALLKTMEGTARARHLHPGDHRGAKGPRHHPFALPAVRLCTHHGQRHCRAARICGRGGKDRA